MDETVHVSRDGINFVSQDAVTDFQLICSKMFNFVADICWHLQVLTVSNGVHNMINVAWDGNKRVGPLPKRRPANCVLDVQRH